MSTAEYLVTGMTCQHCVNAVSDELKALPGVTDVNVDLASGQVTVASDAPLAPDTVAAAVDEAGYQLVEPTTGPGGA
jgi:copper chaperone CopZ